MSEKKGRTRRLFVKMAWRNIFRNKRRTIIAGTAIGIGLAALIFTDALIIGMKDNMVRSATGTLLGEAQIHRRGFRDTQAVAETIAGLPGLVARLEGDPAVGAFAVRTVSLGMVTSAAGAEPAMIYGVDPARERNLSQVDDVIREGRYFGEGGERDVVLGSRLARNLEVRVGDRIVLTGTKAGSDEVAQDLFRVGGIYEFGIREWDGGLAFIPLEAARRLLGLGGGAHEIAVRFARRGDAQRTDLPFWREYGSGDNEAVSWVTLLPQLKAVFDMTAMFLLITGLILFSVVTFGIVNTLFMSFYERMFEFGVLRAVGTRVSGVRRLVVLEAASLAGLSAVLGILLGLGLTAYAARSGIDYRGIEFAGATIRDLIYPVLAVRQFIIYPAAVFVFTLLVSLYPAAVAGRMKIAAALRRSL